MGIVSIVCYAAFATAVFSLHHHHGDKLALLIENFLPDKSVLNFRRCNALTETRCLCLVIERRAYDGLHRLIKRHITPDLIPKTVAINRQDVGLDTTRVVFL